MCTYCTYFQECIESKNKLVNNNDLQIMINDFSFKFVFKNIFINYLFIIYAYHPSFVVYYSLLLNIVVIIIITIRDRMVISNYHVKIR